MNKKLKFTSAILASSLLITPISALVSNYDNVAKAEGKENNQINIQKHIDYIDSQIYLENNNLKINKDFVLNYIKINFKELNINNQFKTPEEYYQNIELSVSNINKKVNSAWYKFNATNGITEKYQSRSGGGFEVYYYWWGSQVYIHNQWELNNFKREIEDYIYRIETIGYFIYIPSLGLSQIHINELKRMLTLVDRTYQDYASVKITSHDFKIGDTFEVEAIQ
ncbi:hypothetical protein [Gemella sp. zg-1178]|uniref:hypothetical protein n=1 Tax=Gemella sp. zg-1178 TaxID=2840372 RepID=UPI001C0519C3|nr:hypothetical protein [Gemella sp. zg-1178]MBU0279357.1 hypothetical protein [Gemella sp. zg-1178]